MPGGRRGEVCFGACCCWRWAGEAPEHGAVCCVSQPQQIPVWKKGEDEGGRGPFSRGRLLCGLLLAGEKGCPLGTGSAF